MESYNDKLLRGYKRMSIVTCAFAIIFAIPILFLIDEFEPDLFILIIYLYLFLLMGVILISPKIVKKIWKNG